MSNTIYRLDRHVGDICMINSKNIYTHFGAYVKSHSLTPGSISHNISKSVGGSSLKSSSYKMGIAGLKLILYVGGATEEICSLNTSNIISEGQNCIIRIGEEDFEFAATLTSFSLRETGIDTYQEVELSFQAIKRLPLVTVRFESGQGIFRNSGTAPSGVLMEILPKEDLEVLQVNEITINRLTRNQPFIIDGLEGKVLCNGVNRFLDTDLIDFPQVSPGVNQLRTSTDKVDITLKFYPTFLI